VYNEGTLLRCINGDGDKGRPGGGPGLPRYSRTDRYLQENGGRRGTPGVGMGPSENTWTPRHTGANNNNNAKTFSLLFEAGVTPVRPGGLEGPGGQESQGSQPSLSSVCPRIIDHNDINSLQLVR
jgi:hypothetical protein